MCLLTVYSGKTYESVSLSQLWLLLFFSFSAVESKGEFGSARARGDSSFCVCVGKYFYFPSRFLNLLVRVSVPRLRPSPRLFA